MTFELFARKGTSPLQVGIGDVPFHLSFYISARQSRRDGALAKAINQLAEEFGEEVKSKLLARGGPLKRDGVLKLAKLPFERQRELITVWLISGKFPRAWQNRGERDTITLPRYFKAIVDTLVERVPAKEVQAIFAYFREIMSKRFP